MSNGLNERVSLHLHRIMQSSNFYFTTYYYGLMWIGLSKFDLVVRWGTCNTDCVLIRVDAYLSMFLYVANYEEVLTFHKDLCK